MAWASGVVARHMAAGHGSTFDGVEPTNGYHPLWLWLLVPVQRLVADPIASMRAALLLSGALGLASLFLVRRILTRVGAETAVPFALLLFAWVRIAWLQVVLGLGLFAAVALPLLFRYPFLLGGLGVLALFVLWARFAPKTLPSGGGSRSGSGASRAASSSASTSSSRPPWASA